jgi:hypothetical protein
LVLATVDRGSMTVDGACNVASAFMNRSFSASCSD